MLIYSEHTGPRLRYILNFILKQGMGLDYRLTSAEEEFRSHGGPKINYSNAYFEKAFNLPCCGLLGEISLRGSGLRKTESLTLTKEDLPALFREESPWQARPDGEEKLKAGAENLNAGAENLNAGQSAGPAKRDMDFDVFAAVFYMISRYEEYLPFNPDRFGRFEAGESLAGQTDMLDKPLCDIWVNALKSGLSEMYPGLEIKDYGFSFLPTIDIDLPYAYLHRGAIRTAAAGIRTRLNKTGDQELRREVLAGKEPDPFDTFAEIRAIHSRLKLRPRIFFLTAGYGRYDKSIPPGSKAFGDLVSLLQKFADPGIHPSYRASGSLTRISREIGKLSSLCGEQILHSRQHYLRFRLPGSYRDYLKAGIRYEYSMGYASRTGFRAGTARPFAFYDLEKESVSELTVIPFQVMDRTLKDYMGLSPSTAMERIMAIAGEIKSNGGTFCTIWHNDAFSDKGEWKGWKEVYLQMAESLSSW